MHTVGAAGVEIPALGFGTWQLKGAECEKMVTAALGAGFRHIDTAEMYDNEEAVGRGLKAAKLPRDEVFLTSKVWSSNLRDGQLQHAAEVSLKRLGLDYFDLYLIHWPSNDTSTREAIGALNEVRTRGLARAVGVANFPVKLIEEAVEASEAPLATNQVEYHPYLSQAPVLDACRRHGLSLTAYCPLARGKMVDDTVIGEIAEIHGRTPAQVTLRWLIQQDGVIAIPKTGNPDRLEENLGAADFTLTDEEMSRISALTQPDGRIVRMSGEPEWDT
ncbi:aldo/keto reductase [Amorphus coralli]|uniref:aldo/keto reductase n=1 Tax=Amorphus coralli TaxID=340680 RepID=UPI00037539FE|nr:aldo/keto reductase [Amorphus coralli]